MLITAAVLPGPPAFVPELMGSAAHELDDLRDAADWVVSRTVSDLLAAQCDSPSTDSGSADARAADAWATGARAAHARATEARATEARATDARATHSLRSTSASAQLVVVGPGRQGEFNAAGPVSFASFGPGVAVPALVEGARCDPELPTPLMVARYLASRDIAANPEHAQLWASARWITTSGVDATALGEDLRAGGALVALILVADGATCHGPKAPRAQDERAGAYDEGVCAALASGRPGRLAQVDAAVGDELGATGPQVWPVLVAAAGGDEIGTGVRVGNDVWVGEVLWTGAPYGVGWAVASWRRPRDERLGDQSGATPTRA